MEYQEALDWLYCQKKLKKREDLSRIKRCIALLKIQTNYQIIHIAGTNGKGSVASYLNTILSLAGKKVGLFVSPFVISFNERIQVNQAYISDEEVIRIIQKLKVFSEDYFKEYQDVIPFFELTLLMALLYFQQQEIDVLVLECGLGGLLDATNALDKDLAIITNIGYEHVKELGPTLEDIARHKLGITRRDTPCLTNVEEDLLPLFTAYAQEHHFPLIYVQKNVQDIYLTEDKSCFTYKERFYQSSLYGVFQAYNASLAIEAIHQLYKEISNETIQKALLEVFWPGRFEKIASNIILDGAHNVHGIQALVQTIKAAYPKKKIKIVFTALKDKAISEMLTSLDSISAYYYFTTILDRRATTLEEFLPLTTKPYRCFESYEEAIDQAIFDLREEELLIITGSLHFISTARKYIKEREKL